MDHNKKIERKKKDFE